MSSFPPDGSYPPVSTAWYEKTWLVVVLCIVFFPVGLYALWKNSHISRGWKVVVSIFFALIILAQLGADDPNKAGTAKPEALAESSSQPALTPAQRDSIAAAEKAAALEERRKQTISANDLIAAYTANEVSADENFKDKTFYVTGIVETIGKDIMDDPYVALATDDGIRSVQCFIDDKQALAQLSKGQQITVYGRCEGLMMNVLMKDGKLVQD